MPYKRLEKEAKERQLATLPTKGKKGFQCSGKNATTLDHGERNDLKQHSGKNAGMYHDNESREIAAKTIGD